MSGEVKHLIYTENGEIVVEHDGMKTRYKRETIEKKLEECEQMAAMYQVWLDYLDKETKP